MYGKLFNALLIALTLTLSGCESDNSTDQDFDLSEEFSAEDDALYAAEFDVEFSRSFINQNMHVSAEKTANQCKTTVVPVFDTSLGINADNCKRNRPAPDSNVEQILTECENDDECTCSSRRKNIRFTTPDNDDTKFKIEVQNNTRNAIAVCRADRPDASGFSKRVNCSMKHIGDTAKFKYDVITEQCGRYDPHMVVRSRRNTLVKNVGN